MPKKHIDINRFLMEELRARSLKNRRYSLRAFAKFLEIHPARLSEILSQKKLISIHQAIQIADKFKLSGERRKSFLRAAEKSLKGTEYEYVSAEDYKKVWNWKAFVVRRLTETSDFKSRISWISQRTGIGKSKVSEIVSDLISAGLLSVDDHSLNITDQNLHSAEDVPSATVRAFHKEIMQKIAHDLDKIHLDERDIAATVICTNKKNIEDAKIRIRKFRKKIIKLLDRGPKEEVYTFNTQLFPLTVSVKKRDKK